MTYSAPCRVAIMCELIRTNRWQVECRSGCRGALAERQQAPQVTDWQKRQERMRATNQGFASSNLYERSTRTRA